MFKRLQNRRVAGQKSAFSKVPTQGQIFNELEPYFVGNINVQDVTRFQKVVSNYLKTNAPGFDLDNEVEDIIHKMDMLISKYTRQALFEISEMVHEAVEESIEINKDPIDPRSYWEDR